MKKREEERRRKRRGTRRSRRRSAINSNKVTIIGISLVVCMLCAVLLYSSHRLEDRIEDNDRKISSIQERLDEEHDRTEEIEALEEEMQTDEYIASVARSKLGLANEGEIIFKAQK